MKTSPSSPLASINAFCRKTLLPNLRRMRARKDALIRRNSSLMLVLVLFGGFLVFAVLIASV